MANSALPRRLAGIFTRRRVGVYACQPALCQQAEFVHPRRRHHLGSRLPPHAARPGITGKGIKNGIRFLLHIPFAPPDILQALPSHRDILGSLAHYDLVGFQTENDHDNFGHYLVTQGAKPVRGGAYEIDGLRVRVGAFPVSIETAIYSRMARNAGRSPLARKVKESLGGCRLILGVDRLDYSKGIPQRIKAFERFLENNPQWHSKVTLLQITPNIRSEIKEYSDIEAEVTTLIGKINGRFGDAAWTPIRYVNKSYSRTALAGIYRAADVGMVTPLRDGMNLVARPMSPFRILTIPAS